MSREHEPQGPIYSMFYSNAGRYCCFRNHETVVAKLQRGCRVKKIQAVVGRARESEGEAQSAGS